MLAFEAGLVKGAAKGSVPEAASKELSDLTKVRRRYELDAASPRQAKATTTPIYKLPGGVDGFTRKQMQDARSGRKAGRMRYLARVLGDEPYTESGRLVDKINRGKLKGSVAEVLALKRKKRAERIRLRKKWRGLAKTPNEVYELRRNRTPVNITQLFKDKAVKRRAEAAAMKSNRAPHTIQERAVPSARSTAARSSSRSAVPVTRAGSKWTRYGLPALGILGALAAGYGAARHYGAFDEKKED